jgi:hypothetical protein
MPAQNEDFWVFIEKRDDSVPVELITVVFGLRDEKQDGLLDSDSWGWNQERVFSKNLHGLFFGKVQVVEEQGDLLVQHESQFGVDGAIVTGEHWWHLFLKIMQQSVL